MDLFFQTWICFDQQVHLNAALQGFFYRPRIFCLQAFIPITADPNTAVHASELPSTGLFPRELRTNAEVRKFSGFFEKKNN